MDVFGLEYIESNKVALIENEVEVTYGELLNSAQNFAKRITERCLIFIMVKNTIETVTLYLGTLISNSVPFLIHETIKGNILDKLLNLYKPKYVLTLKDSIKDMYRYLLYEEYEKYYLWKIKDLKSSEYEINKDIGLLLSTSGSLGSPKCVRISYKNVIDNTKSIIKYLKICENDRVITTLPMDYAYGLSIINTHLMSGATIVLNKESVITENFWDELKRNRCSTFGGVPFLYETLIKLNLLNQIKGMRYLTQAGGKLNSRYIDIMVDVCKEQGVEFIIMYGQTEATARMSYLPWEYVREKKYSIGRPIPGGKFEIIDEKGNTLKKDQIGELVYYGNNVALGYANDLSDLARNDDFSGKLHTGDTAYYDKDKFYYIIGRKNRYVKVYGNRISLDELENKIKEYNIPCACVGRDNMIVIVIMDKDLGDKVRSIVNFFGIERRCIKILFLSEIPLHPSGKIDYSAIWEKCNEKNYK